MKIVHQKSGKRPKNLLQQKDLRPWGIFERFGVKAVCTTDDPAENLREHQSIAATDLKTRVYPTFRPDCVLQTMEPEQWNAWVNRLAEQTNLKIDSLEDLKEALTMRHQAFHDLGCRISDHGLESCFADFVMHQTQRKYSRLPGAAKYPPRQTKNSLPAI